jgi:serine/threonine-protein kinase RsbW
MRLELTADLGKLSQIRDFVSAAVAALGIDAAALDDLTVAIDEAVTNILIHGYDGPGEIELDISVRGSDVLVRLRDRAPAFQAEFSPTTDRQPPPTRDKPGGLGRYLIQNAMDEVRHHAVDGGNQLVMVKRNVVGSSSE